MNIQQKLLQKANKGASGLKRAKNSAKKSGKKEPSKKEKVKASSTTETGISPFPVPWKCKPERKRQKVERTCKDCGEEMLDSDFDGPIVYFECRSCSGPPPVGVVPRTPSLICCDCRTDHNPRHYLNPVMLCSNCGDAHPPIETMCEALWCQRCGVQSHVGACNAKMTSCDICGSYCDHSTPHCPSLRCPPLPAVIKSAVASSDVGKGGVVTRTISEPSTDFFAKFAAGGGTVEVPKIADTPSATIAKDELLKPDWITCGTCGQPGHLMCTGRGDSNDRKSPWNISKIHCTKCQQSTHVTSQCGIRGSRVFGIFSPPIVL